MVEIVEFLRFSLVRLAISFYLGHQLRFFCSTGFQVLFAFLANVFEFLTNAYEFPENSLFFFLFLLAPCAIMYYLLAELGLLLLGRFKI